MNGEAAPLHAILGNVTEVMARIGVAARKAGRDPGDVTLVAVTKTFPTDVAAEAVRCGLGHLGENRVQDLLAKRDELSAMGLEPQWHMIGTLQRNKVRYLAGKGILVHSVDSEALLAEISRRSLQVGTVQEILLQVNLSGEDTKHGFTPDIRPDDLLPLFRVPGLAILGLMTIAAPSPDPADAIPTFARLRDLRDETAGRLRTTDPAAADRFRFLSMGMSHDLEPAIQCGATHVRIGTALFGPRPVP